MPDDQPELTSVLREVAATQKKLAESISAKASAKDPWDKFAALSTFLSSVIIASVAAWFTHQYDAQQLNVSELTILEKFIPHLASGKPEEQKVAIVELSALGSTPVAVQLAKLYPTAGAIGGVQAIGANGDPTQQALARSVLGSFADVPPQAVNIVKVFEGFDSQAYQTTTGAWAIGYGTTSYPNHETVRPLDRTTEGDAAQYLAYSLKAPQAILASSVPYWKEMNANQQSALISFAYNVGISFYDSPGFTAISAALRDRRWADVPSAFLVYSAPGNPAIHAGLLRRRTAEAELWQGKGAYAVASVSVPGKAPDPH